MPCIVNCRDAIYRVSAYRVSAYRVSEKIPCIVNLKYFSTIIEKHDLLHHEI